MLYDNISLYYYNQNPGDIQNQTFSCSCDQIHIRKDNFPFSTELAKRQKINIKLCGNWRPTLRKMKGGGVGPKQIPAKETIKKSCTIGKT